MEKENTLEEVVAETKSFGCEHIYETILNDKQQVLYAICTKCRFKLMPILITPDTL